MGRQGRLCECPSMGNMMTMKMECLHAVANEEIWPILILAYPLPTPCRTLLDDSHSLLGPPLPSFDAPH